MVWASARSAKIFSAVSTTIFSLSATALPDVDWRLGPAVRPAGRGLVLRFMMRKSHRPDKRRKQGHLRGWNMPLHGRPYSIERSMDLRGLGRAIWYASAGN